MARVRVRRRMLSLHLEEAKKEEARLRQKWRIAYHPPEKQNFPEPERQLPPPMMLPQAEKLKKREKKKQRHRKASGNIIVVRSKALSLLATLSSVASLLFHTWRTLQLSLALSLPAPALAISPCPKGGVRLGTIDNRAQEGSSSTHPPLPPAGGNRIPHGSPHPSQRTGR